MHLEQPDTWSLLREESITYQKRGLIDVTLLEQTETPQPGTPQPGTPQPGTPQPETPQPGTPQPETPQPETPQPETLQPGTPQPETPQPKYKILLWPPNVPHEYASEEPLLVIEPQLDPGSTLDPSGPQFLRLVPGQLLVYVPLLGSQPSLLYRVDLRTSRVLQTTTFPVCPATETCQSQALFLMFHAGSRTRWLLHTWRFAAGNRHATTTMLWDGRSIILKTPPATLLGPTWIGVSLKDDLGRPSVREHYFVDLQRPAGWAIEGCLDADGNARPEDLFKGVDQVSFPEEADRDWHATDRPRKRPHKVRSKRQTR